MGQQQLLLLVLGAIIVGAAIVVGINMFSGSSQQANEDAVRQELTAMAARAQEWFRKPKLLGGGGQSFAGATFPVLGYGTTLNSSGLPTALTSGAIAMTTQNGDYAIGTNNTTTLVMTGIPVENTALTITVTLTAASGKITIAFS